MANCMIRVCTRIPEVHNPLNSNMPACKEASGTSLAGEDHDRKMLLTYAT